MTIDRPFLDTSYPSTKPESEPAILATTGEMDGDIVERQADALIDLDTYGCNTFDRRRLADLVNIVGVFVGLKPATDVDALENPIGSRLINLKNIQLKNIITRLGLSYYTQERLNGQRSTYIAKDMVIAEDLACAWDRMLRSDGKEKDDLHRLIGDLLGFPPTAIDHFIQGSGSQADDELPVHASQSGKFFHFLALSLENTESEIAAYSQPLEEATRALLPGTYEHIQLIEKLSE